jgi:hypothetical protein
MRLAFRIKGAEAPPDLETVWRDPESRTMAERVDGATKLSSIGVPREALWLMLPDVTPQTVEQWRAMSEEEEANKPTPPPFTPPPTPDVTGENVPAPPFTVTASDESG